MLYDILITMALPALAMIANIALRSDANLRDGTTFVLAILTFLMVLRLFFTVPVAGYMAAVTWFTVMPGLEVAFHIEPLGMVFALLASGLWIVTHVYAIGYMRGANEANQPRFFACFGLAISAVMGIAFAANLLTLFLFYELLTISTYPLVAHKGNDAARSGARTYLAILIGTSISLFLLAILWTYHATGTLDFARGGFVAGAVSAGMMPVLLALYAFGIGKAALMPFHRWLPAAMVAPTPVSALLHAVAVVKAGVFTMLKVGVYVFGVDTLAATGASEWLIWVTSFTIIAASLIAMTKDNLKARLAYSTVSQLSYITLGMALAHQMAVLGGAAHIVAHAFGKITLFMCAGAIYVATKRTNVSQLNGLGRRMPITFTAFAIGAVSIIGLPPMGGAWSKFMLMLGALETQHYVAMGVFMLSSLLNVAYLLPIIVRGFFLPPDDPEDVGYQEAPLFCWLPLALTALGCLLLFIGLPLIAEYLQIMFSNLWGL